MTQKTIDAFVQLKDYVPLFQTVFQWMTVLIIALIFKDNVRKIFGAIIERIKSGSSLKAGPIEIGEDLKNLNYAEPQHIEASTIAVGTESSKREKHRVKIYENNRGIFLTHVLRPTSNPDQVYDAYIYLIRHKDGNFQDVIKTEFFFGHMWGNKIFEGSNSHGKIGVHTSAHEPFLCTCCIQFNDGYELTLERYIDFENARFLGIGLTSA